MSGQRLQVLNNSHENGNQFHWNWMSFFSVLLSLLGVFGGFLLFPIIFAVIGGILGIISLKTRNNGKLAAKLGIFLAILAILETIGIAGFVWNRM